MAFELPPGAYGRRTESLQRVISTAEGLRLLEVTNAAADVSLVSSLLRAHLLALDHAGGGDRRRFRRLRVVVADLDAVGALWPLGQEWRAAVAGVGARLFERSEGAHAEFFVPPIWPIPKSNVFGLRLVATDEAWGTTLRERGRNLADDPCWHCLTFAEDVVGDCLIATILDDPTLDVFAPLLDLMRVHVLPVGRRQDEFVCLEIGDPSITSDRTHPLVL